MAQQQFDIEILSVSTPVFTKTARGGYNSLELAFKNLTFEGKVEGKKLVDFNDKAVFEFFKELKNGDKITVTKDKGENDQYWKWVGAEFSDGKNGAGTPGPSTQTTPPVSDGSRTSQSESSGASRGRVTGSNYETPEERAKRQIYIVRQSSIGAAIELLKHNAAVTQDADPVNVSEVLDIAKQLEQYVFS